MNIISLHARTISPEANTDPDDLWQEGLEASRLLLSGAVTSPRSRVVTPLITCIGQRALPAVNDTLFLVGSEGRRFDPGDFRSKPDNLARNGGEVTIGRRNKKSDWTDYRVRLEGATRGGGAISRAVA